MPLLRDRQAGRWGYYCGYSQCCDTASQCVTQPDTEDVVEQYYICYGTGSSTQTRGTTKRNGGDEVSADNILSMGSVVIVAVAFLMLKLSGSTFRPHPELVALARMPERDG